MTTCHFKRKAFKPCNLQEMNKIITNVKNRGGHFYLSPYIPQIHGSIKFNAFIEIGMRILSVTTRYEGKIATWRFDMLTGKKSEAERYCSTGMKAYICLRKFADDKAIRKIVSPEDFVEFGKNLKPFSTGPFMYFNETHNKTELSGAIGYDMNSAYSFAMLGEFPDTSDVDNVDILIHDAGIVSDKQIGFDTWGNLVEEGCFAPFRFKKIKSPFKRFISYYYDLKKNAKTSEARKHAKDVLNMSVGYLQRINPFLRATIVSRANNTIKSLIDEDTVYCNTDCIVSLKKRTDLKIGNDLGEWKIEHTGVFKYRDYNYQWNNETPTFRGVPKKWFKKGYNLLTDDIPECANLYEYDPLNNCIKIVKEKQL